jgi:hypothetical protein
MANEPKPPAAPPTQSAKSAGAEPEAERPMAAVLAEFAAPLFLHVDESTNRETLLEGLRLLVTIWNAVVVDAWGKGTDHIAQLEAVASEGDALPELSSTVEFFVQRKRELFSSDLRAVAEFDLTEDTPGKFSVHASARLPPPSGSVP